MHMADALLSPAVGGTMWAAAAGTIAYCSAKVRRDLDDRKVPLMGVLGAFLFAAQMINFTIPATGSSGHLGGGLLLAVLLGPHAAFLTIASVLMIQALFFADGGLLALGCNIINLGFFPAFIAYPLVYRSLAGRTPTPGRLAVASLAAAIVGLQLGAFAVVLETALSGIAALPFATFVSLMQPIHLGIGVIEGVVTALIIAFLRKARPDIVDNAATAGHGFLKSIVPTMLALALITGGFISWFASEHPDGLEWSIAKITGKEELTAPSDSIHDRLARLQERLAFLPGYDFKPAPAKEAENRLAAGETGDARRAGTSVAGILGSLITLGVALLIGFGLRKRQQLAARKPHSHEHAHPHQHQHEHRHWHGETVHSHAHGHEHSHPHPHVHDHSQPHAENPNPRHTHEIVVAEHDHNHDSEGHGDHDHYH